MNKEILRLAVPNIISNLSIPLISSVDIALMGHGQTEAHLGALAIGTVIFNSIYWGLGFLRMGTTGMVAQAYGESNEQNISRLLGQSSLLALIIAVLLLLFQQPLLSFSLSILGGNDATHQMASTYFNIVVWAAPAALLIRALNGWYFGMQNAKIPMAITIFENLLNIVISYYLVRYKNMEVAGVAIGTLVARYAGLIVGLICFRFTYNKYLKQLKLKALYDWQSLKKFFSINTDIFIRTLCLIFAFGFFKARSLLLGETITAVNVIYLEFMGLLSFGVDGFAFAAESLVGKYLGQKNESQYKRAIKLSIIWGIGLGLLYTAAFAIFGLKIFNIYTDNTITRVEAPEYLVWLIIMPLLNSLAFVWDGIYVGATASKAMRNTMILSLGVFLITYYATYNQLGNHALWLAMAGYMASRSLFQTLLAPKYIYKLVD